MDLTYRYAIARQQQLLSDAARSRPGRRSPIAFPKLALWSRRQPAAPIGPVTPTPCPTC